MIQRERERVREKVRQWRVREIERGNGDTVRAREETNRDRDGRG